MLRSGDRIAPMRRSSVLLDEQTVAARHGTQDSDQTDGQQQPMQPLHQAECPLRFRLRVTQKPAVQEKRMLPLRAIMMLMDSSICSS